MALREISQLLWTEASSTRVDRHRPFQTPFALYRHLSVIMIHQVAQGPEAYAPRSVEPLAQPFAGAVNNCYGEPKDAKRMN